MVMYRTEYSIHRLKSTEHGAAHSACITDISSMSLNSTLVCLQRRLVWLVSLSRGSFQRLWPIDTRNNALDWLFAVDLSSLRLILLRARVFGLSWEMVDGGCPIPI